MIRYQDNFLSEEEFDLLKQILNPTLTYSYRNVLVDNELECDTLQNFQFVHSIHICSIGRCICVNNGLGFCIPTKVGISFNLKVFHIMQEQ